jgi:CRISPR-associated protein Csm2
MNQRANQAGPRQFGHQGSGRGGPPQSDPESIKQILTSLKTVEGGYFSGDGKTLRPALLDQDAQNTAQKLEDLPTTQLRRFFGQVSAIKRRLDMDDRIPDEEILAQVAYLKASAAYAAGRDERKGKALLRFLVTNGNTVRTRADFLAFHRHFETVVAFHKVYAIDNKQN